MILIENTILENIKSFSLTNRAKSRLAPAVEGSKYSFQLLGPDRVKNGVQQPNVLQLVRVHVHFF